MNKLIEELARKTVEAVQHKPNGICDMNKYNQKFAELIVAECLEACSRANEIRHFVPPTQEQVVLSCMREIETIFRS